MSRAKDKSNAAPAALDYAQLSRQPWTSLVFVAPMLAVYELGVLSLGSVASRNGADVWLRTFLDAIGLGQYFLLPLLVCGILLGWHFLTRAPWTLHRNVLGMMFVESLLFGGVLLAIAQLQGALCGACDATAATSGAGAQAGRVIGYLGAGIYEELLFRLMLLPVVIAIVKACSANQRASAIAGIVLVSLLFSAVHYKFDVELGPWRFATPYGDAWNAYTFTFRFLAGAFFAVLFQWRGFGIAAGSHALYDIAVAMM